MKEPYTRVYSNGSVSQGRWVLGMANSGSSKCMVYSGNSCTLYGTAPAMRMVGTS